MSEGNDGKGNWTTGACPKGTAGTAVQERAAGESAKAGATEADRSRSVETEAAALAREVRGKPKGQLNLFPPTFDVRLLSDADFESRQQTMREWVELHQRRMLKAARIAAKKCRRAAAAMAELETVIKQEKEWRDKGDDATQIAAAAQAE